MSVHHSQRLTRAAVGHSRWEARAIELRDLVTTPVGDEADPPADLRSIDELRIHGRFVRVSPKRGVVFPPGAVAELCGEGYRDQLVADRAPRVRQLDTQSPESEHV